MLIRFVVSNFMSFKDETEFNMLKGKGNGSRQLANHIVKTDSGVEVLKTAAIYGANAAGKSNLIKAIAYLKDIVINGNHHRLMPQSLRFRLDDKNKLKPTMFRIEFVCDQIHFDYAIEIKRGKITQEWLYEIKLVKERAELLIFERKNNEVTFGNFDLKKKNNLQYISEFLKHELHESESTLHLLSSRVDGTNLFNNIFNFFDLLKIVTPESKSFDFMEGLSTNKYQREFVDSMLIKSNTGIEKIVVDEIELDNFFSFDKTDEKYSLIDEFQSYKELENVDYMPFIHNENLFILKKKGKKFYVTILKTKHFNSNNLFNFSEESDGTNRLFELIPAFQELRDCNNSIYFIDEIERSMHPILAKELIKFYSAYSKNSSQLIFTTHESHLLDDELLRRDEIWFTEKRTDGSTEFYPLSNFNPRGDKVLERGYLQGRYGGIPFLGDFSKLVQ